MVYEECRHELNPAWCAICTGRSGAGPYGGVDRVVSSPSPAQYLGSCDPCGGRIELGDMVVVIREHPDDVGETVHEDCADRGELYV